MKFLLIWLLALFLIACANTTATPSATTTPDIPIPKYQVAQTEDKSYGTIRRYNFRISLPEHYGRTEIERIAKDIVEKTIEQKPVNAISVMFYGPKTSTDGTWDIALAHWAPHGNWSAAPEVKTGDYATFQYSLTYHEASELVQTQRLVASGEKGLLGIPLPVGARLVSRKSGDAVAGQDPSETYQISANATEIASFFTSELIRSGWLKEGISTSTGLIYRRGELMIGVLIKRDGGSFTLMGS
jgi:hypothetical protein